MSDTSKKSSHWTLNIPGKIYECAENDPGFSERKRAREAEEDKQAFEAYIRQLVHSELVRQGLVLPSESNDETIHMVRGE